MKLKLLKLSAVLALAVLAMGSAAADQKRYAVMPFETGEFGTGYQNSWWSAYQPKLVNSVADMLTTEMVKAGYDVLERQRLNDILKEQDLQTSGRVAPETAGKVGQLAGAQFLVMGTITEWGISNKGYGASNIPVPSILRRASVNTTTARCVIDFRVVDVQSGRTEAADSAEGRDSNTSFSLTVDWYRNINFDNNEWWGSKIGKATRKAVREIVAKMLGKRGDDTVILEMASADQAIVEIDEAMKLRKGDQFEVFQITHVTRNDQGKVIFTQTAPLGHAEVEDLQDSGAILRITDRMPGAEIKAGCMVRRRR